MRKMKLNLAVFVLMISLLLTSCSMGRLNMFDYIVHEYNKYNGGVITQLLSAINDGDKETVRDMFAANAIKEDPEFDDKIDQLFDFVEGTLVSYDDWAGPGESGEFNSGYEQRSLQYTYDVVTSKQNYRFAIKEYTVDTSDKNNIGIYSLYVIKFEDDPYPEYAYWGDGNWTPGINFNCNYEEE